MAPRWSNRWYGEMPDSSSLPVIHNSRSGHYVCFYQIDLAQIYISSEHNQNCEYPTSGY
ncbi:unnamed protein product [Acanthoscelides obtectus]|uniref:Uncharacterized protein n=1 Tax=Acanthoscelides obtectus TaxID=200917 RepID=A0A9P0NZ16_ACAOB|nr:unnamed protein product [Acanthoscelides obtectus]CAK1623896.1 hypothetical protein AOBTE_LOCUS2227 [Acanthoscelides obtectus]